MQELRNYQKIAALLFLIIEVVGFFGILSDSWHEQFIALTPINLVFMTAILLLFHEQFARAEVIWMLVVVGIGYGVEVLGVKTGRIFGTYEYGNGLGPKLLEVPPTMGLNWFLLCYTSVRLANALPFGTMLKALLASCIMVLLDVVMEPVAIAFDYWSWGDGIIPLQNYVAWFTIAFALNLSWFLLKAKGQNIFSKWLFLYLLVFFSTMNVIFTWDR